MKHSLDIRIVVLLDNHNKMSAAAVGSIPTRLNEIFNLSFSRSGNEAKCGVELQDSKRNASKCLPTRDEIFT